MLEPPTILVYYAYETFAVNASLYYCFVRAVVPSILMPPANFTYVVNESDPVIFMCSATGIPPPEITWMRNGLLLDDNEDPRISLGNLSDPEVFPTTGGNIYSVSHNLTISNTRDNDSDTYTCVASNGNAVTPSMDKEFELIVQGRLKPYSLLCTCKAMQSLSFSFTCSCTTDT